MFLDLDRSKNINDVHGHAAGNAVLREVADRLSGHAREEDTVCRNGGDEFLYLLVNPQGGGNIERIAQRISQPMSVGELQLVVRASIGIAIYPSAQSAEELIKIADSAMYQAKKGGTGYAFAVEVKRGAAAA